MYASQLISKPGLRAGRVPEPSSVCRQLPAISSTLLSLLLIPLFDTPFNLHTVSSAVLDSGDTDHVMLPVPVIRAVQTKRGIVFKEMQFNSHNEANGNLTQAFMYLRNT